MNQKRSKAKTAAIILAGIIAILFWSELFFSNLPSLADVTTPTATLGWTTSSTRFYFTILALLDVVGGVGVVLYLVMALRSTAMNKTNIVVWVTVSTLCVYGIYQFITAFRLPPDLQPLYWAIGIAYVLMGVGLGGLYRRYSR